jgi:hypothetical protein
MGVVLNVASGPRAGAAEGLRSLTGHFSPDLCTIAARYRASQAHIFGHLFGAEFEVLSLHQVACDCVDMLISRIRKALRRGLRCGSPFFSRA